MSFFSFLLALIIVGIFMCFIVWFALGAMHQHLMNKGEGFGRDDEMHRKLDDLKNGQRNPYRH